MGEWDSPVEVVTIRKSRWPRIVGLLAGGLALLLLVAYFTCTSSWFLKAVILPKAGAVLHCTIKVEKAVLSPFSSLKLSGLEVQTTNREPLLRAEEVHARYSLWAILAGQIEIEEATLESAVLDVIENLDGTTNLDPIRKALDKSASPSSAEPVQLHLGTATLKNATLRYSKILPSGGKQVAELTKFNLSANDLANDSAGKISLQTELRFDQGLPASTNGRATARLSGQFKLSLNSELVPGSIKGALQVDILEAFGAFRDAAATRAIFDADVAPKEIRLLALRFFKGTAPLGAITINGPFNAAKIEGSLNVNVTAIDRQVLNLAGALFGGDFNLTAVTSSNVVEITRGAQAITLDGQIAVNRFSLSLGGQSTPTLDMSTRYKVTVDRTSKHALLQTLTLHALQNQSPLLRGVLAKPMRIDWSGANAPEESSFNLILTSLNLGDWRAFAPEVAPTGHLDLQLTVRSQQAGKRLELDFRAQLADFAGRIASNRIDAADLTLAFQAGIDDFSRINLAGLKARIAHRKEEALNVAASGQVDLKTRDVNLKTAVHVPLTRLSALLGNPQLNLSSGVLKFDGELNQKNVSPAGTEVLYDRAIRGNLELDQLGGSFGNYTFDRFAAAIVLDAALKKEVAEVQKFNVTFRQAGQAGGTADFTGTYDLAKTNGQITVRLVDLNQSILRSFAGSSLGSNQLESVSIGLEADAVYNPKSESSLKGDLSVEKLILDNAQRSFPKTPTSMRLKLDGTLKDNLIQLRQCLGSVQQGTFKGGDFDATGQFNLQTKMGKGIFKLTDLNQHLLQPLLASALGENILTSASVNINTEVTCDLKGDSSLKGEFQVLNALVTDPKGQLPSTPLTAIVKIDGSLRDNLTEIRQFVGYVKQGDLLGGSFDAKGSYHVANQTGDLEVRLTDLNQNALAPFIAGSLGDKKLEAVSINLTAQARYNSHGESAAKADFQVSNLLVKDPSGRVPATPLAFGLQFDGSLVKQLLALRQCQLSLGQTARAKNQLQLAGNVDMTNPQTIAGQLKLTAESLDLNPIYDLLASPKPTQPGPAPPQQPITPPTMKTEPAPIQLPLGPFIFEAAIGHLYLRELDAANVVAHVKIDDNKVTLDPLNAGINNAPLRVRAFANLGVPGYEYNLNFETDRLPLEPVLNSFALGQRGQVKGVLIANAAIKGAGITDASLQKKLSGTVTLDLAEANIQLVSADSGKPGVMRVLTTVFKTIAVGLQIPDLTGSPVEVVKTKADVDHGTVNLRSFLVQSAAFQATSAGTISLADPLEASRLNDLPVDIALERNIAVQARLVSANTDPKLIYIKLPTFVHVRGTAAAPEVKTDLGVLALKAGTEAVKGVVGNAATGALEGLGNLVPGGGGAGASPVAPAAAPAKSLPRFIPKKP